jgi:hypothetical protein
MAVLAAWKSGAGDFFSRLGQLAGSWARIAAVPRGSAPVRFLAAAASSSISAAMGEPVMVLERVES